MTIKKLGGSEGRGGGREERPTSHKPKRLISIHIKVFTVNNNKTENQENNNKRKKKDMNRWLTEKVL